MRFVPKYSNDNSGYDRSFFNIDEKLPIYQIEPNVSVRIPLENTRIISKLDKYKPSMFIEADEIGKPILDEIIKSPYMVNAFRKGIWQSNDDFVELLPLVRHSAKNPNRVRAILSLVLPKSHKLGDHLYTTNINFNPESFLTDAQYFAKQRSEPRQRITGRPTKSKINVDLGNKLGDININGRIHTVYDMLNLGY